MAAAVALTLEDFYGQTGTSGGGLRGGYWQLGPACDPPRDFTDVPGVEISGTIRLGDSVGSIHGRLSIRGRLAGELMLRGLELSGRLNGAQVHAKLSY